MNGKVIKSTGSWYIVMDSEGNKYECRIKGKFRMKGLRTTNPIAVGDKVDFHLEPDQPTALITHLHERQNYIIRKSINQSHEAQILSANMDQALLLITLVQPRTSLGFIDRYLVSAEAFHIPTVLIFNKFDLYSHENLADVREIENIYSQIGYLVLEVSVRSDTGLNELKNQLAGKTSLISGHSGVGKSTLINYLVPGLGIKTADISDFSEKGTHTTTFAEMFELPMGGSIIDTPGIRELGVIGIEKETLSHYFPEMKAKINLCRFHNCQHIHEPGCAIISAVDIGEIEASRYDSYRSMYLRQETRA